MVTLKESPSRQLEISLPETNWQPKVYTCLKFIHFLMPGILFIEVRSMQVTCLTAVDISPNLTKPQYVPVISVLLMGRAMC